MDPRAVGTMQFTIIRTTDELRALKPEWDELWQRSRNASYFQSAAYAIHSWTEVAEPSGCRLFCITARNEGRLTVVWPLKIYRKGLWHIVKPLASNAAEGTDLLVEDDAERPARVRETVKILRRRSGADIVDLRFVHADTELGAQLRLWLGAGHVDLTPFVAWKDGESFEAYARSLSKGTRKVVDKKHRRLKSMGELSFELVRGSDGIVETTRSLLQYKRAWSNRLSEVGDYVHSERFERFLTAISLASTDERHGMLLFVLKLDGVVLAAQSAAVGHHVDWLAAAYNPDFHQFSPGIVLNEYCLRWAHERHLPVMMGPGQQANKEFWCKRQVFRSISYTVRASAWGAAALQIIKARSALAAFRRRERRAASTDRADDRIAPGTERLADAQGSSLYPPASVTRIAAAVGFGSIFWRSR